MNNWERLIMFVGIFGKAFFKATTEIAWGVAGLLLLGGMITQYIPDSQAVYNLQDTARIIYNNWSIFWACLFGLSIHSNWWRLKFANSGVSE